MPVHAHKHRIRALRQIRDPPQRINPFDLIRLGMHNEKLPLKPKGFALLDNRPGPGPPTDNRNRCRVQHPLQITHAIALLLDQNTPGSARGSAPRLDRLAAGKSTPSCAQSPQHIPADNVTLDFGCAVPDPFDPRIPPKTLQRIIVHQTHPAMHLDRRIGYARKHLARI